MFIIFALIVTIILTTMSYPFMKLYQLNGYRISKFFENIFTVYRVNDKNKLVFTKRVLRFYFLAICIIFAFFTLAFYYVKLPWVLVLDVLIAYILTPFLITFVHMILLPVEKCIQCFYIKKAKKKLQQFAGKKIAIVGSFGKTSIKNYLTNLLTKQYKVNSPPKNYNTPMGVCKFVLEKFDMNADFAIFEMGARRIGDIEELTKIIDPDIAILTAIGEQHIETFGSIENVLKTKNEIVKNIKDDAEIYFNCYSENTQKLYEKCNKNKYGIGKDAKLLDYNLCKNETSFSCELNGEIYNFTTKLLGKYNVENLLISIYIAKRYGVSMENIVKTVKNIKPVKNRLELITTNDMTIIDDTYNSNYFGAIESLNILKMFDGEKIVVTPGLVELGNLQYEKNFCFAKEIGGVADHVIIMNDTNKIALLNGLKESGFNCEKIFYARTRESQKELLKKIGKKRMVVLFENDLPDNFR